MKRRSFLGALAAFVAAPFAWGKGNYPVLRGGQKAGKSVAKPVPNVGNSRVSHYGREYRDQTILVRDGEAFYGCKFINCTLEFETGYWELLFCVLHSGTGYDPVEDYPMVSYTGHQCPGVRRITCTDGYCGLREKT